ncbi:flagellar protein FlaG [Vibrio methylphosphonaticus]|uniref:flagellar protein FlaG n=1 Tax=Vibrio methylphosphonaticus TaxID=2946866 RepID=UPI002029C6B6|nr:flagellar protein FlaG [Vibrio methylphosphonaticus]MCL9774481.1 flagellar protein FlaG [Vibrio methylphosphonaticus]
MDISSYASNIQPFASSSGTEIASKNTTSASTQGKSNEVLASKLAPNQTVNPSKKVESEALSSDMTSEVIQQIAKERRDLNDVEREKMVERLDEFLTTLNTSLSIRMDEDSGRHIVTIIANDTGEIIRQVPDEDLLVVLERLEKHASVSIDMRV